MMLNDDDDQVQSNQYARILQLEQECLRYKLDVLVVSEARWIGSGTTKTPSGHTVFLYSGKDESADKTAGVGFKMTTRAHSCLRSWQSILEQMITARFRIKLRNIKLIQCYAPIEKSSGNGFYNLLAATYSKAFRSDIIGDLNAKVGADRRMLGRSL